jgi:hypothetical protein
LYSVLSNNSNLNLWTAAIVQVAATDHLDDVEEVVKDPVVVAI